MTFIWRYIWYEGEINGHYKNGHTNAACLSRDINWMTWRVAHLSIHKSCIANYNVLSAKWKIIQPIFCICLVNKYGFIDNNEHGICYCANWKISQTFFTIHQLFFLRKFCHFIVAQSMPQTIVFTRTQITPLNEQYERNRKNQSYALHLL